MVVAGSLADRACNCLDSQTQVSHYELNWSLTVLILAFVCVVGLCWSSDLAKRAWSQSVIQCSFLNSRCLTWILRCLNLDLFDLLNWMSSFQGMTLVLCLTRVWLFCTLILWYCVVVVVLLDVAIALGRVRCREAFRSFLFCSQHYA